MRFVLSLAFASAALLLVPGTSHAQAQPETARAVADGVAAAGSGGN